MCVYYAHVEGKGPLALPGANTMSNFQLSPTANAIATLLRPGANMCTITTRTPIALSAANKKHNDAYKVSRVNVQLFNALNDFNVYANAVKRNADKLHTAENNGPTNDFIANDNYYMHNDACFSIVQHKSNEQQYVYYIANSSLGSDYYINGQLATKHDVAALCTPSGAKKLLNPDSTTHNKTNDVTHSVVVRTVKVENVISITANKQTITF